MPISYYSFSFHSQNTSFSILSVLFRTLISWQCKHFHSASSHFFSCFVYCSLVFAAILLFSFNWDWKFSIYHQIYFSFLFFFFVLWKFSASCEMRCSFDIKTKNLLWWLESINKSSEDSCFLIYALNIFLLLFCENYLNCSFFCDFCREF